MDDTSAKKNHRFSSTKTYLVLMVVMVILAGLQAVLPLTFNQGQQMSWLIVLAAVGLGWIGLILSPKAGFPEMWAQTVSGKQRFW